MAGCGAPPSPVKNNNPVVVDEFNPSLQINSNATHTKLTNVTLSLNAVGATEMYITTDVSCASGGTWETYSATKSWTLNSLNTVNFVALKVRNDEADSECVSSTIIHDTVAPTIALTLPAGDFVTATNAANFTIGGACSENGSVAISGDLSSTTSCSNSAWSRSLNLSARPDGVIALNVTETDLATNIGNTVSRTFTKDTVAPTLTLSAPTSGTTLNATQIANVTFSGACSEDTRQVMISGAFSDSAVCTGGAWSKAYNLSSLPDGAFVLNFNHVDAAGNSAPQVVGNYIKDATLPTVTIVTPLATNFVNLANEGSFVISGTCSENGQNVVLSGAVSQTLSCSANSWSVNADLSAVVDGPITLTATHADVASNSAQTTVNLSKDTVVPQSTSISLAGGAAVTTSLNVTLSLAAIGASEMYITNTAACSAGGVYEAFAVTKNWTLSTAESVNTVYVKFKDLAGNESACISDDIIHNATPPTLSFTSPVSGTWVNNANKATFTVSGACSENGQNVVISGTASASVVCAALAWTAALDVSGPAGGANAVTVTVNHSNANAVPAPTVTRTFSKDVVSPAAPVIVNPATSPYVSSSSPLAVSGTCEASSDMAISGAQTLSTACSGGTFSLNLAQATDGSYNYDFTQTDAAGNVSVANSFQWVKDSSIPDVPILSSPSPNPKFTNTNSVVIAGSCVTGYDVTLEGDLVAGDVLSPSGQLTMTCASNVFSFTVQKTTDGTFNFSVYQTNIAGTDSPSAAATWTRDTVAPLAPTITTPPTNPYTAGGNLTLSGACESLATVNLSGDSVQSLTCASGSYTFTVVKSVDATYNFSVSQTDRASNVSAATTRQWIRNSSVLPTPVITDPTPSPITTNDTALQVLGTCVSGYTVSIASGAIASEIVDPANTLTQVCAGGTFAFTINKATDATYNFTFTQTDGFSTSPTTSLQWTRDTTAPVTTIATRPTNPNYKLAANFTFTANQVGSIFECNLDSAGWTSCVSPFNNATIANGNHTLEVRAIDPVGNIEAVPASYSWTQQAYNTLALYQFNSATPLVDSGLYTSTQNNPLTNTGTTNFATGKFAQAQAFASASSQFVTASDNAVLRLPNETMTLDMWVKLDSLLTTNNTYIMLASKMGASPQMGWEFGFKRVSNAYRLVFRGSLNGTSVTEKTSTSTCTVGTTNWIHVAVTWNKGSLRFFCDGVSKGTGTIGTAGTSVLFNSNASLRLGRTQTVSTTYQYLNGKIDEFRLSQMLRWTGAFTPATSAYNPD